MKIDSRDWEEFRIGDYFEANLGTLFPNKDLNKNGKYPVVTGITENNGINGFTDELLKDFMYSNALTISNRGEYSGTTYYHDYKFLLGSNAIVLKPIDFTLNKKIGLFLSVCINKLPYGGYNAYPTKSGIIDDIIKLPAKYNEEKKKYEPDWEFVEKYIEELEEENKNKSEILENASTLDLGESNQKRHKKIDLSNWYEFDINRLFSIEQSKGDIQYQKCLDGKIPLVSSGSDNNNSIVGYIAEGDGIAEVYNAGNITIDMFGSSNYQNEDFYAVSHGRVTILKPKFKKNKLTALFIVACLDKKFKSISSYKNMCTMTRLKKEKIKLPALYNEEKNEHEPDWEYMETYVRNIQEINRKKLELLEDGISLDTAKSGGGGYNRLDITDWHEFKVKELFHIRPTKHHNLTNAELFDEDGTTIVVVNSSYDNGIGGKTLLKATEKAPMITFSDTTNADSIFLQTEDFAGYSHIQCLNPLKYEEKWNETTLMFFLTVFRAKAKTMNYDYSNKFTRESASNLIVPLPAIYNEEKDEYKPDWEYMENYIEERKRIIEEKLRSLKI